jgi:hypothetical protein
VRARRVENLGHRYSSQEPYRLRTQIPRSR